MGSPRARFISSPGTSPSFDMKPGKSCLKNTTTAVRETHYDSTPRSLPNTFAKRITFSPLGTRCLVTNTIYEEHSQDGKTWRQHVSARVSEERMKMMQQALSLSGASGQTPHVQADQWADRGWESAGLGEDTPMGGMSPDMDIQAARWHKLDQRLEEQLALAERNRTTLQNEARSRSSRRTNRNNEVWHQTPSTALHSISLT